MSEEPAQCMPASNKQSVIIFDWDDTLMSSSWVDREKLIQIDSFTSLPIALQALFSKLEEHVAKCLQAATELGYVIVITNAEAGWVEYSAKRFMPRLIPILNQTRIVSARSTYEQFYPGSPLCWKAAAFAHEANVVFSLNDSSASLGRQIISFGDSNEERTAVKIAAGQLEAVSKSIKFVDLPTPDQLCKQIETVTGWLTWVCDHTAELDLMMKPSEDDLDLSQKLSPKMAPKVAATTTTHITGGNVVEISPPLDSNAATPYRPPPMATLH